jgi:hypothetical protein
MLRNIINQTLNIQSTPIIFSNLRIENTVRAIIFEINQSSCFEQVGDLIDELVVLQIQLAKNTYINKIEINDYLKMFLRDFDRSESPEEKIYLYKKIKSGSYS